MKRLWQWLNASRWRKLAGIAAVIAIVSAGGIIYLDEQHNFGLRTEAFRFTSGDDELDAILHLPTGSGLHGVVVFVPGDGPAEPDPATLPISEALARAGYATVRWNKPGIGDSTGNWLEQDMEDRADEVIDALATLRDLPDLDLDLDDVGVIGASQGGWVIPLVAERIDVDFFIAWSTAISWEEQGRYLTERELDAADASPELREQVLDADETGDAVLATGTYDDHRRWHSDLAPEVASFFGEMSEDRWQFAVTNRTLDASSTLPAMRGTPVLLLLGGRDANVDVADTERVYREILSDDCLEVRTYPEAFHSLVDQEGFGLTVTAILSPRDVFADGLLEDIERFATDPHIC